MSSTPSCTAWSPTRHGTPTTTAWCSTPARTRRTRVSPDVAASSVGSRPNLGHPGAKHNRGMDAGSQLELLAQEAICRLYGCRYAELRVASGSLSNLYVYMATARPGDRILAFSDAAAGHPTHHAEGAAGPVRPRRARAALRRRADGRRPAPSGRCRGRAATEADHRRRLDVPASVRRARRAGGRRRGRRARALRRRAHGRPDRRRPFPAAAAGGRPRHHGLHVQELRRTAVGDDPDRRPRAGRARSMRSPSPV